MFVVILTYTKPLAEVDVHLEAHRAWLRRQYEAGADRAALDQILAQDPFNANGAAQYQVIQFTPNLTAPDFASLKEA